MPLLSLTEDVVRMLADLSAKATVLLVLVWIIVLTQSRSSSAVRHRLWSLCMIGLLLLPVLSLALPRWNLPLIPVWGQSQISLQADSTAVLRIEIPDTIQTESNSPNPLDTIERPNGHSVQIQNGRVPQSTEVMATAAVRPLIPWFSLSIVGIWTLGVVLGLAGVGFGFWRISATARQSKLVEDPDWTQTMNQLRARLGLRRDIELRILDRPTMPLTWGIFRPTVLLPVQARDWDHAMRRAVLLHELAHVSRCDVMFQLIGRLACAVYWYHPLAWYALHRLRQEREQACDDLVVQTGEQASAYGQQLLEVARLFHRFGRPSLAVEMVHHSQLESRLRAMFDAARSHTPLSRKAAIVSLTIAAMILSVVSVIRPVSLDQRLSADDQVRREEQVKQPGSNETKGTSPDELASKVATLTSKLTLVFFFDQARRTVPGVLVPQGDSTLFVMAGTASVVPEGVGHAIDRTFMKLDDGTEIKGVYDRSSNRELMVYRLPRKFKGIDADDVASVSVGDKLSALTPQFNVPIPAETQTVTALNQTAPFKSHVQPQKHYFSDLIEINRLLPEGTVLIKGQKVAGVVLIGARFGEKSKEQSFAVPAERILALGSRPKADKEARTEHTAETKGTLRVRVVGPDGQPLANASVFRNSATEIQGFPWNKIYFTDAEGVAEIELPKTLSILRLWARRKGYCPMFANWEARWQGDGHLIPDEFEFRLEKGSTIGGVVQDFAGKPIANVKVEAMYNEPRESKTNVRLMYARGLATTDEWDDVNPALFTDQNGRWSLDNVPPEDDAEVYLKFTHPDFVSDNDWGFLQKAQQIKMQDLRNQTAVIVMQRSVKIEFSKSFEQKPRVPVNIVIAQHVILWEGKEVVTWEQAETKMASFANPAELQPTFYVTTLGEQSQNYVGATERILELKKRFGYHGYRMGSLIPERSAHYDKIQNAADLLRRNEPEIKGRIVDVQEKPVANAQVVLIPTPPTEDKLHIQSNSVYLADGRIDEPFEANVVVTDNEGHFSHFHEHGRSFAIIAVHPDIGIAVSTDTILRERMDLMLQPWAGLTCELSDNPPNGRDEYTMGLQSRLMEGFKRRDILIWLGSGHTQRTGAVREVRYRHVPPSPTFNTTVSRIFPDKTNSVSYPLKELTVELAAGERKRIGLGPITEQQRDEIERRKAQTNERMKALPK